MDEKKTLTTGRRVWLWTAVIVSAIVLVLSVGGIVGAWVGRGVVIDAADGVLDGVHKLAGVGREGVNLVDGHADDLRAAVDEVGTAVDQISQNVADKGVVLTLLPPEKEQKIENVADRIGEAATTIRSIVDSVVNLIEAVEKIPFVSFPKPDAEKIDALQSDIAEIQAGAEQLASDIQAFREGTAEKIDAVSEGIGDVHDRIAGIQDQLDAIDQNLDGWQTRTVELKSQIRTWTLIAALVVTLILLWVIYAMVILIRTDWSDLRA